MSKFGVSPRLGLRALLAAVLSGVSGLASADYGYNLQAPVTPIARDIFDLHMLIYYICVVIFVVVFSFMFYAIVRHRKSVGHKPATFHESTTIEIVWTVVPFLILVVMAIPSTATVLKMYDTRTGAKMAVQITGYQWKWQYSYPDQHISFFSNLSTPLAEIENKQPKDPNYLLEVDRPLVLPIKEKIRLLVTANDVIHSWWVPQFGVKRDAIPGFIHESWVYIEKPGTYRGQCAELCGKDHGFMPIVVKAVTQDDFNKWVASQQQQTQTATAESAKKWTKQDLLAKGKEVYNNCAACHGPEGKGVPGQFPALAHDKIVNGPLNKHIQTVLFGVPNTAMPAWGTQLSDADIAAVVTYERNSFGNHTGDVVQPAQIKALRK